MSERLTALGMGVLVAGLVFLAVPEVGLAENDGAKASSGKKEVKKGPLTILKRAPVPKEAGVSPAARIRAALDSRVRVRFSDTPLSDVCALVGERLGIPVVLDCRALDEMGVGTDTPMTCSMKDVRLGTWLDFRLGQMELTWMIRDEVLLVTTVEVSMNWLDTRIYDVSDLVGGPGCPPHDFDSLIDLVATCIAPVSWDTVGGAGSIQCLDTPEVQALVVAQTRQAHETIEQLFADLRVYLARPQGESGGSQPRPCSVQIPSGEREVRKALAKKIDVDFVDTPLDQAIEELQEQFGVEIELDGRSLDDMGIPPDTPVTFKVSGVSGVSALNLLLRPLELTFVVKDDFLVILTSESAASDLTTRVYEVSDLVNSERPDFDSLTEAITGAIDVCSWDQVGGPASIASYHGSGLRVLVVSQTGQAHQQIEKVLDALRNVRHEVPPCMKRAQELLRRSAKPEPAPSETPQMPPCFGDPMPLPGGQPAQGPETRGAGVF